METFNTRPNSGSRSLESIKSWLRVAMYAAGIYGAGFYAAYPSNDKVLARAGQIESDPMMEAMMDLICVRSEEERKKLRELLMNGDDTVVPTEDGQYLLINLGDDFKSIALTEGIGCEGEAITLSPPKDPSLPTEI